MGSLSNLVQKYPQICPNEPKTSPMGNGRKIIICLSNLVDSLFAGLPHAWSKWNRLLYVCYIQPLVTPHPNPQPTLFNTLWGYHPKPARWVVWYY